MIEFDFDAGPIDPKPPVNAHTYDEWRDMGYQVQSGEKSRTRDAQGRAVFLREQVKERNLPRDQSTWPDRPEVYDWDEDGGMSQDMPFDPGGPFDDVPF
jgi:hypothetical protein